MASFRGTITKVREFDYLMRKINCEESSAEKKAIEARETLILSLVAIIQELNWKEFELLTDLIFRQAGWQRVGILGKTQKDIDLDLLSPFDQERYQVQVKSAAGSKQLQTFHSLALENLEFAHYYFVVHQPEAGLVEKAKELEMANDAPVKVWLPGDIARLVVNYGLVDWVIRKAK